VESPGVTNLVKSSKCELSLKKMYYFSLCIIVLCILGHSSRVQGAAARPGETCHVAGPCEMCEQELMNHVFCQETGKRQAVLCKYGEGEELRVREFYESCTELTSGSMVPFIAFQAAMAVVGGGFYYLLKSRKLASMTPYGYDYRRVSTSS